MRLLSLAALAAYVSIMANPVYADTVWCRFTKAFDADQQAFDVSLRLSIDGVRGAGQTSAASRMANLTDIWGDQHLALRSTDGAVQVFCWPQRGISNELRIDAGAATWEIDYFDPALGVGEPVRLIGSCK